ncbi:MAG: TIGR03915 family putative DNA repair protein [Bacteroides sp.]|nr:TIGR03915 family putative DNA repair protein [Bacteroides sp.]
MILYRFDNTFEGLLTCVFDAYARRQFPDQLVMEGEPLPLFYDEIHQVVTDEEKALRVWRGLKKKLSSSAMTSLAECWLAEEAETPMLLFYYICKAVDTPCSIETNFADPIVLELSRMWKRVDWERIRLMQFIRFQKAADGTYFAAVKPEKNALPLITGHFRDRFRTQRWIIYDIGRGYGFYYDMQEVKLVTFSEESHESHLVSGMLNESLMDKDEQLFQQLWRTYFKAICIKERLNPRKHRQDMPVRYWKYLTEKQKEAF